MANICILNISIWTTYKQQILDLILYINEDIQINLKCLTPPNLTELQWEKGSNIYSNTQIKLHRFERSYNQTKSQNILQLKIISMHYNEIHLIKWKCLGVGMRSLWSKLIYQWQYANNQNLLQLKMHINALKRQKESNTFAEVALVCDTEVKL